MIAMKINIRKDDLKHGFAEGGGNCVNNRSLRVFNCISWTNVFEAFEIEKIQSIHTEEIITKKASLHNNGDRGG